MKAALDRSKQTRLSSSKPSPSFVSDISLTDTEIKQELGAIVEMAKMDSVEMKLEAAKIFYHLSCRDEIVEHLVDYGCVDIIASLMSLNCDCTKRNAVLALTNLSESPSCQVSYLMTILVMAQLFLSFEYF